MKKIFIIIFYLCVPFLFGIAASADNGEEWYRKWPKFPKGNRITAQQVKRLMMNGEKMIFIYSGYEGGEGDDIICGSLIIPYSELPPFRDGSRVKINLPKDWWIFCYCP